MNSVESKMDDISFSSLLEGLDERNYYELHLRVKEIRKFQISIKTGTFKMVEIKGIEQGLHDKVRSGFIVGH